MFGGPFRRALMLIFAGHRPVMAKLLDTESEYNTSNRPGASEACRQTTFQKPLLRVGGCCKHANPSKSQDRFLIRSYRKSRSQDSVVDVATGYWLDDRGVADRVPVGSRIFFLHVVQTGSGAHLTSYPMGTGGSFRWVKRTVREADHSPPTSGQVKKIWIYTSSPPYAFMAWCLIISTRTT
jgi:hypothetical protein